MWSNVYNGAVLGHKKGRNLICNNMDRNGGLYVKQNKPSTKGQVSYDLTYM